MRVKKCMNITFMNVAVIGLLVTLLGLPGVTMAADADVNRDDVKKEKVEKEKIGKGVVMDTVVVSATRTETTAFEAPASVSVVNEEEIKREQPTTLKDILEDMPNVDFSGGTDSYFQVPTLRGLNDEQAIIKIDGAKQQYNDNAGNARNPVVMDPNLLKQVEVVRGPSSTLHGSGGIGGVIAMRTKDASDFLKSGQKVGANISAGHQSVDSQEWMSSTVFGETDLFGVVANLTTREFGHLHTSDPTGENTIVARTGHSTSQFVKGSIKPSDGQYASLSVHNLRDNFDTKGGRMYRTDQNQVTANYDLNPDNNEWIDLHFVGQYMYRYNSTDMGGGDTFDDTMTSWGGDIQNTFRFGPKKVFSNALTMGTDYYFNEQKGNRNCAADNSRPNAEGWDFGMFIQDDIGLPFGFSVIPAVRYTKYNRKEKSGMWADQDESEVTPKVSVKWQTTDWLNLFTTYAESFRPPSLNEIYFYMPWPGIGAVEPNPNLKPESGKTWEFGAGLAFDGVFTDNDPLRFKAIYFREKIKDFQSPELVDDSTPGAWVWSTVNKGSVRRFGYEAELDYTYDRYSLRMTYGKVMGVDTDTGERTGYVPDNVGLRLGVDVPEYDLSLTWKSHYTAESKGYQPWNGTDDSVPSYFIHGLAVAWTPGDVWGYDGLRVDAGVDNLFDKKYLSYRGGYERGRNVKLGLSCSF